MMADAPVTLHLLRVEGSKTAEFAHSMRTSHSVPRYVPSMHAPCTPHAPPMRPLRTHHAPTVHLLCALCTYMPPMHPLSNTVHPLCTHDAPTICPLGARMRRLCAFCAPAILPLGTLHAPPPRPLCPSCALGQKAPPRTPSGPSSMLCPGSSTEVQRHSSPTTHTVRHLSSGALICTCIGSIARIDALFVFCRVDILRFRIGPCPCGSRRNHRGVFFLTDRAAGPIRHPQGYRTALGNPWPHLMPLGLHVVGALVWTGQSSLGPTMLAHAHRQDRGGEHVKRAVPRGLWMTQAPNCQTTRDACESGAHFIHRRCKKCMAVDTQRNAHPPLVFHFVVPYCTSRAPLCHPPTATVPQRKWWPCRLKPRGDTEIALHGKKDISIKSSDHQITKAKKGGQEANIFCELFCIHTLNFSTSCQWPPIPHRNGPQPGQYHGLGVAIQTGCAECVDGAGVPKPADVKARHVSYHLTAPQLSTAPRPNHHPQQQPLLQKRHQQTNR